MFYDIESQKKRIQSIYDNYTDYIFSDGNDERLKNVAEGILQREMLSRCYAFFSSGNEKVIESANKIIESLFPLHFCHFSPVSILELLICQKDKLTTDNYNKMYDFMKNILNEYAGPELDFVGVNDNFPMIASYVTIVGGQLFKNKEIYEIGVERLKQLPVLMERRGSISEFNSPHYIFMEINALALIAERAEDESVREIALKCEERMWVEALGHAMPDLSNSAGPISRLYTSGFTAGSLDITRILYILLGEKSNLYPNCKEGYPHTIETPFINSVPYCHFHCPKYLVDWYLNREYPHEFFSTFEANSSDDGLPHGKNRGFYFGASDPGERDPYLEEEVYEYPSVIGDLVTYMEKNYALGTSTKEWHNGLQCYSFYANYKKVEPVKHFSDMGCVFTKYIINDKLPWQPNEYEPFGMKDSGYNSWDMGRKMCLQHKNSAIVIYKPKAFASKNVESMRLGILFPVINKPVNEIWLGDKKVENFNGKSKEPCSIFIDDGLVYMAIHPLTMTDYGRDDSITVELSDKGYIMISLYNYKGESRDFAKRGFLLTTNGFAFEIRDKSEFSSFEEFRNCMKNFEIKDYLHTNAHVRQTYQRTTEYKAPHVTLSMETTPVSEGVRYQMVNGKLFKSRKLFVTGLDTTKLPYMEE